MARNIGRFAASTIATFAICTTTAFAQSPALVPRDSRPFTPPDMQAPPPRATAPQAQPPAQAAPAQAQAPVTQLSTPTSPGVATIAPAPLLQKPAVPPVVNLQNGLLSIDASNSNLSDVLASVKRATGAAIEGVNNVTERVVVHLGPGRPNDVISTLLAGSRYDYVLLGSTQQPGAITRIMLSVRQGGEQGAPQAASNVPPAVNNGPDDDGAQEDTPEQREQDVRQAEPPPSGPQGNPQPGQPQNAQQGPTDTQPKTPQQLFEEIQRMQQQRQQQSQQDQQNQQQPAPPPPD